MVLVLLAALGCGPRDEAPPDLSRDTLSAIDLSAGPGAMAPHLSRGRSGPLLTWLEPVDEARQVFRLLFSRLEQETWSTPVELVSDEGFFANWADLPMVTESARGELVAHWLGKLGSDTYAYGVQLVASSDDGVSWRRLGLLHDDDSPTEHGFVSWLPLADGVRAFWLDGRQMADGGPMQLRTTILDEEGLGDGSLAGGPPESTVLDERVCECCSTDAALTAAGPVVVFRDRSEDEVRDISIVRAVDEGWSSPMIVSSDGWRIHGCPVNGPAVAADGTRVAVAWFTLIDEQPRVLIAFSDDAGASFETPIQVDGERPVGRVDLALDSRGDALVTWLGGVDEERAEIRLAEVSHEGHVGPTRVIAETTPGRSAGVPRMIDDGDRLVFAWTESTDPSTIRTAILARSRSR